NAQAGQRGREPGAAVGHLPAGMPDSLIAQRVVVALPFEGELRLPGQVLIHYQPHSLTPGESYWPVFTQPRRSGQIDLEVRTLIVVPDPGRARPAGEGPGPGAWHDVAEPDVRVGLEPAVLHGHRAFLPAVEAPGDPFGGHV